MNRAFIRKGHGYEAHSTQGRCEAFDGFDIIAAPLGGFDNASRESRSWRVEGAHYGVTTASHAIKLATDDKGKGLYILMHHGGGREVLQMSDFYYDGGIVKQALLAMPERALYGLLYSIWSTADNARNQAQTETGSKWAQAYVDKRIRKVRGRNRVEIIPEWEIEMKARKRELAS